MLPTEPNQFHHLAPEEVLTEVALPDYKLGIAFIYDQLHRLNTDLFILDRIIAFPFDVFVVRDEGIFWGRVMANFLDAAVLTITRLAIDTDGKAYTLNRLRNHIRAGLRPEFRSSFEQHVQPSSFDQESEQVRNKVKVLRNRAIAHSDRDLLHGFPEQDKVDYEEITALSDTLNAQFNALAFNVAHMMLPVAYSPAVNMPDPTDIEQILDSIARRNLLLNMPETSPGEWPMQRKYLPPEHLAHLNRFRAKFGLTPA